jgi:cytochrome c-type biogenesis protein CcmH
MMLWPILALMTAGAVAAVWWPLARLQRSVRSGSDIVVYHDQLDEIDRDEAAGLIGNLEAEAARVEVSRRLIAAAETAKAATAIAAPGPARGYRRATLAAAIVLLPLGAGALYSSLGSPYLLPVSMNAEIGNQQLPEGIEQTVAEVENYLESNPKNGRGWELLAPVYLRLGRFEDAVRARRNALEIFGPDAARLGDLGEAIVMASSGVVTPEAKDLFIRAEAADPEDVMAQYYLGLSAKQEGRRDEALKRWNNLVSAAKDGAEWLPLIKNALARIDEKSPSPVAAPSAAAQPAVAAPPDHSDGAIEAMVERLAGRLKKDGSDIPGWIQLVRSYRVLGRPEKAKAAIADAHAALAGDREGLQHLEEGLEGLRTETAPGAPAAPAAAVGIPQPGPNASQVAAAAQMAPVERNSMIEGMVTRLADRLRKDGSDVPGWIQLVRSYRVLGSADRAQAAIADARAALANDREGLQRLEQGLEALLAEAAPSAPPATTAAGIPPPGPNVGQIAAAAQMAPAERNSMIEGMVARLAQKMAENGSDVDGWLRLIKAYSVLGERDKALAAATNARTALAGHEDSLRRIGELAKELGLEGS